MTESLAVQGCEFEIVEDNRDAVVGQRIACLVCRGKFRGDAVVMRTEDGFTDVVAGGCIKYGIRPQIPTQSNPPDTGSYTPNARLDFSP